MHTFLDAKTMAKILRAALAERSIDIAHSDSLELVARQFGLKDWNTLAAKIDAVRTPNGALPEGWVYHHGNGRDAGERYHRLGLDVSRPGAMLIESIGPGEIIGSNFATLMQSIDAGDYRGTSLRLCAELSGEGVDSGALWLRIDDAGGRVLGFDNMMSRSLPESLTGSFEWTERHIVLAVPAEAASIHFGALLKGQGRLWVRRFRLDEAGDAPALRNLPRRPSNLDFGVAA